MPGMPGFVSPLVSQPYRRPCVIVPNPEDFRYCGAPSGEHTALDMPICDECYAAVSDETLHTLGRGVQGSSPLGGLPDPNEERA